MFAEATTLAERCSVCIAITSGGIVDVRRVQTMVMVEGVGIDVVESAGAAGAAGEAGAAGAAGASPAAPVGFNAVGVSYCYN